MTEGLRGEWDALPGTFPPSVRQVSTGLWDVDWLGLGKLGFGGADYPWQIRAGLESWREWPHWRLIAGKRHAYERAGVIGPWPGAGGGGGGVGQEGS